MKKLITLTLIMLPLALPLFAQDDCKMCGDWQGIYSTTELSTGENAGYRRMVVRIKKTGTTKTIRIKNYAVDNPSDIIYWTDIQVAYCNENTISFKCPVGNEKNWDDYKINGRYVACAYYTCFGSVNYVNDFLSLSYYFHVDYVDKNNNVIKSEDYDQTDLKLFQEDNDW